MKNKNLVLGIALLMPVFGAYILGCGNPADSADSNDTAYENNAEGYYASLNYDDPHVREVLVSAETGMGTVTRKTVTLDEKNTRKVRVYLDTTGNGSADTVLGFDVKAETKPKEIEKSDMLRELESLCTEGAAIQYVSANAKQYNGDIYYRIIWHDIISINNVNIATQFPNPYWFPFAWIRL